MPRFLLGVVLALIACDGAETMSSPRLEALSEPAWTRRTEVRAFYSGHSLSDGVPEVVEQVAGARGQRFEFEVQTAGYSTLRERTKGADKSAREWTGYRAGQNRNGSGLDVARELREPTRLSGEGPYDVLVVTERHDLPVVAREEQSALYLTHFARQLLAGNPEGEVLLYHTWLELDVAAPEAWVDYERSARRLWECVASRANLELGSAGSPRVRVLPGGSALAELVMALFEGKVPGIRAGSGEERVRMLFADNVHLSDVGRYFLGLVHYGVLYGQSPEGAPVPATLDAAAGTFMQQLAWQHVHEYGRIADAAARRDMASCRSLLENELCPAYHRLRTKGDTSWLVGLKRTLQVYRCGRGYADPDDAENPFRSN